MAPGEIREFFNRFIPASILASGRVELILRARVLAGLFFSNIVISLFMLAMLLISDFVFQVDVHRGYYIMGFVGVCLGFQLWLFYGRCDVISSGIIFSMVFFGATLGAVILTGGWSSPLLLLFFCSPAISFLVGGRSEGLYMTSLVTASALCLFIANQTDFELFQIIRPERMEVIRFCSWTVSLITLICCMAVYDSLLHSVTRYMDSKK
jgi:hypothetical protein